MHIEDWTPNPKEDKHNNVIQAYEDKGESPNEEYISVHEDQKVEEETTMEEGLPIDDLHHKDMGEEASYMASGKNLRHKYD
jgi:hypothetical protein